MEKERSNIIYKVCGSYPGAVPWLVYSDKEPSVLAEQLAESAGCLYYSVDGTTYGPFGTTLTTD